MLKRHGVLLSVSSKHASAVVPLSFRSARLRRHERAFDNSGSSLRWRDTISGKPSLQSTFSGVALMSALAATSEMSSSFLRRSKLLVVLAPRLTRAKDLWTYGPNSLAIDEVSMHPLDGHVLLVFLIPTALERSVAACIFCISMVSYHHLHKDQEMKPHFMFSGFVLPLLIGTSVGFRIHDILTSTLPWSFLIATIASSLFHFWFRSRRRRNECRNTEVFSQEKCDGECTHGQCWCEIRSSTNVPVSWRTRKERVGLRYLELALGKWSRMKLGKILP
jgi:hypothetical protein